MNFVLYKKEKLNNKSIHVKLLSLLGLFNESFIYYLDTNNNSIHYLLFGKEIKLIQIIFLNHKMDITNNFNILEYAIKNKKIAKNYISYIDKICQFNFILYENNSNIEFNNWIFREKNNFLPKDIYNVNVYNLYYINKKENSNYKELSNFIYNL